MALFGPINRALANVSRAVMAEARAELAHLRQAAAGSLRGVFFGAVNYVTGLLRTAGVLPPVRPQAAAVVSHEIATQRAAAALQREFGGGGGNTEIPVDPKLGPGEFRLDTVTEVHLANQPEPQQVYLSIRRTGIPTAEELESELTDLLMDYAAEYDVYLMSQVQTNGLRFLRVEGGG